MEDARAYMRAHLYICMCMSETRILIERHGAHDDEAYCIFRGIALVALCCAWRCSRTCAFASMERSHPCCCCCCCYCCHHRRNSESHFVGLPYTFMRFAMNNDDICFTAKHIGTTKPLSCVKYLVSPHFSCMLFPFFPFHRARKSIGTDRKSVSLSSLVFFFIISKYFSKIEKRYRKCILSEKRSHPRDV